MPNGAPTPDRYLLKLRSYAQSLPYSIEPNSRMQDMLDFICLRIVQSVEAKDYDPGFMQWDSMLTYWSYLKYPIPKEKRVRLIEIYYYICVTPGMPLHVVATGSDALDVLTRSKNKTTIKDIRLPWLPLLEILKQDLFLTRRQFEVSQTTYYMGHIASTVRRFFHPATIDEMLARFVPRINGTALNSLLTSQYFLLTFLPQTHPQSYLPMLFRLWESVNSYMFDDHMLFFLSQLTEMHMDPSVSDPKKIGEIPDDAKTEGEGRPNWPKDDLKDHGLWTGIFKDVGIFSDYDWHFIMCKCLASMEIPLADSGSLTTGPSADNQASFEIGRLPKPTWRIISLARIIVYSMTTDGREIAASTAPTPLAGTPSASGMNTPRPHAFGHSQNGSVGDYLTAHLMGKTHTAPKTYVAGSKALDSLVKLVASTESFFHPSNSGTWTADLSAFIKYVAYEFNKRWHEEQKPDCKTPTHRRLTRKMKYELVKSFRTVALLAMFSEDSTTVNNISSCLKWMSLMEPELILQPILDRAVPSLEALVETQRTIAVIKALGSVAPALVSREVYYSGAKHLVPILQLLIPGIDLNDPSKTLCTTTFLLEISQYIEFGDLTSTGDGMSADVDSRAPAQVQMPNGKPSFSIGDGLMDMESSEGPIYTKDEEDALLKESTGQFPDWIASFIRRVIVLFDNLPEEAGGASEVQLVDAVTNACSQICVHLSEPLFDLVLNMIFDYASTNVRPNAVRAVHQLVECVANAHPAKTLAKFVPFCINNIYVELDSGASSTRTTSTFATPLPSDATFHWNLAVLRGAMFNDGKAILKYRKQFLPLLQRLRDKTFAKRGFSWSAKLLSSMLLTLTHTYPLEDKFVNPEEWKSEEFRFNHHKYWGKLYTAEEVKISWHVPNGEELDFALEVFKEIVEPTLGALEKLLEPGKSLRGVWALKRGCCSYLSFVRNAFSGTPTFVKEHISEDISRHSMETTDILNEIPEMIATIDPINSGFAISDPEDPRGRYYTALRSRFGKFLHEASSSLRQQGEENTVDAVYVLIQSIRTYLLDYGDSKDSYYVQFERYGNELSYARQYVGQKAWPRAVFVRRARLYHAARLRWNSIERRRGSEEDLLIDDVAQWCLWQYATGTPVFISLLDSLCNSYDGIRRRCLPHVYKALSPGTEDDRMKGALWTLNSSSFVRRLEPTLVPELLKNIFGCQANEKAMSENGEGSLVGRWCRADGRAGINSFVEPNFLVYEIEYSHLNDAIANFKAQLPRASKDQTVTLKCAKKREERIALQKECIVEATSVVLGVGNAKSTHWRYSIFATRCLRTLVRKDVPTSGPHLRYFLEKAHDNHPSLRYYSQRALMKALRYIKLRTYTHGPVDLALEYNRNPLKHSVKIDHRSHEFTAEFLQQFKKPLDMLTAPPEPIYVETVQTGWVAWSNSITAYEPPHRTKPSLKPWEPESEEAISVVREKAMDPKYWKELSTHYTAENHNEVISSDNVAAVKSIVQLLEDEAFSPLQKLIEEIIEDPDQNKQRGAAELLAGLLNGTKHWPSESQKRIWDWAMPLVKKTLGQKIKTDTLPIWMSFLEYIFHKRDPRRIQALVDYLVDEFNQTDYNGESSLNAVKALCFFRAFYEEENWKFTVWADAAIERVWKELSSEHDEVRAYISELLAFADKVKRKPTPTVPIAEVFVRECRTTPLDGDIFGMRGNYHKIRVAELVERFPVWREERLPGARAFQSTYDKVGTTVCRWLFQTVHDTNAISVFDYVLPLMPELFRFTEVNDNDELLSRARTLLVRMCGVTPPRSLISPILSAIFDTIQNSPSWKVRLQALPLVQVFYFRQVPLMTDAMITEILEVLCKCLDDEVVEVREMAATTLSGVLRLSPRRSQLTLKDRFVRLLRRSPIPNRQSPTYNAAIRQRHAAILGIVALVDSYPYTVERWMPELLTNVLAEHTYDPIPISTTVRKCASNFKKTHQDTWHEDSKRFTEDQLAALSTLLTGSSYCTWFVRPSSWTRC
ncbi:hypothetical protein BV25DRAFT_1794335 [Artomyces pyxidatus]|uniref:Uncharacterized protein n=1 Tax=Artomyces pyxidatus TaxID=48021 RepID=A0ACB8TH74_9AGAM|nr:hypothetical protein BV25DRAFT_1794335 [Artomyces pyxidatus]